MQFLYLIYVCHKVRQFGRYIFLVVFNPPFQVYYSDKMEMNKIPRNMNWRFGATNI